MSDKTIRFSQHARTKFEVLLRHGLSFNEKTIIAIINDPDSISEGYLGRKVAQGALDDRRVLRIVYEETTGGILVITFYPGKRERYEKSKI